MPQSYNQAPYNDDYDRDKNYVQMLAVPGRAEQAREFTQQGTMLLDFIGRVGDSLYSDGHIINGCELIINGGVANISAGRIWLEGLVRIVPETRIEITGLGSEIIGAKIVRSIVTEAEDSSLRDPAQGYENYGLEGAHRVKEDVIFTLNDEEAATIYRINDGVIVNDSVSDDTGLNEILARRTFDENGNYKVEGLELQDRAEVVDDIINISLTAGKAYIRGYEVTKPYNTIVKLNKSMDLRQVLNEPKVYHTGTETYKLNNTPCKAIDQLTAVVEVTDQMSRGSIAGGTDYLTHSPVVKVMRVWNSEKEFVQGTDYQLTNDGIDWSLAGKDPEIGTTYYVTYRYNDIMTLDTDFTSQLESDGTSTITFINASKKPVNGTQFDIDYHYYLYRVDVVLLDKDGNVSVLKGKSEIGRLVKVPNNGDNSLLPIGYVVIYPNSGNIEIHNYNTTRMSQGDLYNMSRRLDDLEYNQAITDLDDEAMSGEAATDLKGVFTDGFIGASKADLTHPDYNCSIVIDGEYCTLPINQGVYTVNPNLTLVDTIIGRKGRLIMCPYVDKKILSQGIATTPFLVNPYAVYNPLAVVDLNPAVDNWIDTEVAVINKTKTHTSRVVRGGYFRAFTETVSQNTSVSERVVSNEIIEYMRQKAVIVKGSNFTPYEDNIICKFDDKQIPLKPRGATTAGTVAGSIKVSADGTFEASFTVPANTPCGKVAVELIGATGRGIATYEAQGTKQIIEREVLTTINNRRVVDPLAQSFQFSSDTVLTKVGLYFAAKDPSKGVVVQIRNVVNGYPGDIAYAQVTVPASSIITSANGTVETVVDLNQPVYCNADTQYAVCILSDSNVYQLWTAVLGEKDVLTGKYVTSQPYVNGVMFSSSNAQTWTAHQTTDLKFNLYKADYTADAEIIYDNATELDIVALVLAISSVDYQNSGIEWFYRISSTSSWIPIDAFSDRELGSTANNIQIKCVIHRGNGVSPIVAGDCVNIIGVSYQNSGAYVSREVTTDEEYKKVRVILEVNDRQPAVSAACKFEVYIQASDDSSNKGWRKLTAPTRTIISETYNQYEYKLESGISAKNYRVKVEMSSNNPIYQPRIRRLMSILKY